MRIEAKNTDFVVMIGQRLVDNIIIIMHLSKVLIIRFISYSFQGIWPRKQFKQHIIKC